MEASGLQSVHDAIVLNFRRIQQVLLHLQLHPALSIRLASQGYHIDLLEIWESSSPLTRAEVSHQVISTQCLPRYEVYFKSVNPSVLFGHIDLTLSALLPPNLYAHPVYVIDPVVKFCPQHFLLTNGLTIIIEKRDHHEVEPPEDQFPVTISTHPLVINTIHMYKVFGTNFDFITNRTDENPLQRTSSPVFMVEFGSTSTDEEISYGSDPTIE